MDGAARAQPRPGRRQQDVADRRASPAGRMTKIQNHGFPINGNVEKVLRLQNTEERLTEKKNSDRIRLKFVRDLRG
jgi:hypothetical protein